MLNISSSTILRNDSVRTLDQRQILNFDDIIVHFRSLLSFNKANSENLSHVSNESEEGYCRPSESLRRPKENQVKKIIIHG
ncbi:hypothetical protein PGB90_001995 [Kerria lacca]